MYYIKYESDQSYIIAPSTTTSSGSMRITADWSYEEWTLEYAAAYYKAHPEKRFQYFDDTKQQELYIEQLDNYHTQLEPLQIELRYLEQWFVMYDQQVQQYNRAIRLNLPYDAKYGTIEELDAQAVTNSQRISELRKQIEELEKNKPQLK